MKVALAFSGGLDTTVCTKLLEEEYGYDEVIGVTVDVGQPDSEFAEARETAEALGVEQYVVDAKAEFADLCFDAVKCNADYQGYPLGTALARPIIAQAILDVAVQEGCDAVAHGCTGKGNDQLRFEAVWRASDLDVIAPVREMGLTRKWEREYAADHGLPVDAGNDGEWSIDTNLWSRSVEGGALEDPGQVPTADIYEWTADPGSETGEVTIEFEQGVPVAVDGEAMAPVELIEHLNDLAGGYGVGRSELMEDRMLGLKVRSNYEHPAATTLLTAHEALEGLVLTKDERAFKQQVDHEWSETAYEGLVTQHPLARALEAFVDETQQRVTGTVTVTFEGGQARAVARESEHAAYSESAASFDTESVGDIAQEDATGVAKYHGFQGRLASAAAETGTDDFETEPDPADAAAEDAEKTGTGADDTEAVPDGGAEEQ